MLLPYGGQCSNGTAESGGRSQGGCAPSRHRPAIFRLARGLFELFQVRSGVFMTFDRIRSQYETQWWR